MSDTIAMRKSGADPRGGFWRWLVGGWVCGWRGHVVKLLWFYPSQRSGSLVCTRCTRTFEPLDWADWERIHGPTPRTIAPWEVNRPHEIGRVAR